LSKHLLYNGQVVKDILDHYVDKYNTKDFIAEDPISLPHAYSKSQDVEIVAFWTAMLSWGQRGTIINKSKALFEMMGNSPHDFILNHSDLDLKPLLEFKHRTFLADDTLTFIKALQMIYQSNESMEDVFVNGQSFQNFDIELSLSSFHNTFFNFENHTPRTKKHVATPERRSTCKRLNMFLRWMVRKDERGVDFGLWTKIPTSSLLIPYDLHVDRVSRRLGMVTRKQIDWTTVIQLSDILRDFDPIDPVKYDFALFGMGILED
jgi:uncharacterized protein (TIGR02757 family)